MCGVVGKEDFMYNEIHCYGYPYETMNLELFYTGENR